MRTSVIVWLAWSACHHEKQEIIDKNLAGNSSSEESSFIIQDNFLGLVTLPDQVMNYSSFFAQLLFRVGQPKVRIFTAGFGTYCHIVKVLML